MTRGLFPLFWFCFHQMNGDLKKAKSITFPVNPLKTDWSFALARFTYFCNQICTIMYNMQ